MIFWLRVSCGVKFQVKGKENIILSDQKVVVLSKHQSTWETLFLQGLYWPASTILKRELLNIPFFGWGLRATNPIAIDRSNPRAALKQVKSTGLKRLTQGLNIIIFPEGTRVKPGEQGVYARSGADIAVTAKINVQPVAVNSGVCWPIGGFRKYPGLITVSIGPVVDTEGKTSKQVTLEAQQWIEEEMNNI